MVRKAAAKKPKRGSTASKNGPISKRDGAGRKRIPSTQDIERPPATFRGLMPTPPEVEQMMEDLYRDLPISESGCRAQLDYLCERYYFGGNQIAYRDTPNGREILAVGVVELDELEKKPMSRKERRSIVTGYAEPW